MDSIAPRGGHWQPLRHTKPELYDSGIIIHRKGLQFVPDSVGRKGKDGTGGEITEFTPQARARLRRALMTRYVPDSDRYGMTLTVPWIADNFGPLMDEFRECVHRFEVIFRRLLPTSAYIDRIELQQRGAPHLHAVVYVARTDARALVGTGAPARPRQPAACVARAVSDALRDAWIRAVSPCGPHGGDWDAFGIHGADLDAMPDEGRLMRYIFDHTSKAKQAQLGYKGKQWGMVGKSNLLTREALPLRPFEDAGHEARFVKALNRALRYRVECPSAPFGYLWRGGRRKSGAFFLSLKSVRRIWACTSRRHRPHGHYLVSQCLNGT